MTVETILAQKGRSVATFDPARTLGEAARELSSRRIGAVVIVDGDMTVLGILSERDIVRAVAKRGSAALDEPVDSQQQYQQQARGDGGLPAGMEEAEQPAVISRRRHA